jgi:hypothetical protein
MDEEGHSEKELEEEMEVKDILDCRVYKGQRQYKVLWKNYDISEATWEPADSCANANTKVLQFHKEKKLWCSKCNFRAFTKAGIRTHVKSHEKDVVQKKKK